TELAEVRRLLGVTRLLTLLGTGGVGKTRLALEAAAGRDDACLVELGAVTGPAAVAPELLAALGRREEPGSSPSESLVAHLAGRSLLLVLDNCEHVIDQSAEVVAAVLRSCPKVTVLATSREPLRVAGETTWRVPSLAEAEAGALFRERARAARPDLDWDGPSPAVAQICRRLDGIPLAVELAAARTRAMSVDEIAAHLAAHLDSRFALLTGGDRTLPARQQTLQAAVEWTYQALPPVEARLFDRLSVFAGGFSLRAAEQVCAGGYLEPAGTLGLVAALVDRSLVLMEPAAAGGTRYRLLETLRQFGRARLGQSNEGPAVADRHLAWAMDLATQADRRLGGPDQGRWLEALELAHDDIGAALVWAGRVSPEAALRLVGDLGRFWEIRGHLFSGRRFLEAALAAAGPDPSPGRARALDWAGTLAQQQGDYAEAGAHFRAGLAAHRALGHDRGVAAGLHGLGNLAILRGDLVQARRLYEESLAIGRRSGDEEVEAAALANLGSVAENQGDLAAAETLFGQSLAVRRPLGDEHAIALVTGNLGYVAFQTGDLARARRLLDDSLAMRRRLGDRAGTANALGNLGYLSLVEGDLAEARSLLRLSLDLAEAVGDRRAAALARLRLARVARAGGDTAAAVDMDRRAVPAVGHLEAGRTIAEWLEGLAATAVTLGCLERAAGLLGAAAGLRDAMGAPVPAPERAA
ncbi:MAG: ATP-binding protein, partial [Acidimicrobiales bacterium]